MHGNWPLKRTRFQRKNGSYTGSRDTSEFGALQLYGQNYTENIFYQYCQRFYNILLFWEKINLRRIGLDKCSRSGHSENRGLGPFSHVPTAEIRDFLKTPPKENLRFKVNIESLI